MKLSIIIPVYNQERLIKRAVDSIPLRDDIEIIVINDGSTDNTSKAVKSIKRDIIFIDNKVNKGVAHAENCGFNVAKGEYLMRLDSDDYIYDGMLEKLMSEIDGTDVIYYDLMNNEGRRYRSNPENARHIHSGALKLVRREFLGNLRNNEDLRFMEDRDLFDRLIKNNPTEKTTNLLVVHYNSPRVDSLCWNERNKGKMVEKYKTVIYYQNISPIGGIEQWIYSIAKLYSDTHDITVMYKAIAPEQLKRLKPLVKCVEYKDQLIECDTLIHCLNYDIINTAKFNRCIATVHADFSHLSFKMKLHDRITDIIAVSKNSEETFTKIHQKELDELGLKVRTVYNPLIEELSEPIKLISATRLSPDKGGNRMKKFAKRLIERGVHFYWEVYTNSSEKFEGIENKKPTLDILWRMKQADYVVQLSDTEGMPYTIREANYLGTPLLITPLPILKEIGISHGNGAYILNFDMSNMDEIIDLMLKGKPKVEYKRLESDYSELLGEPSKSSYKEELKMMQKVKATKVWEEKNITDSHNGGKIWKEGEVFEVSKERLETLLGNNPYKYVFVEAVEEPKKEVKTEVKKTAKKTTKKK